MALASLDAWARLLANAGAWRRVSFRYWPRVAVGLMTSVVGTALTLPERLTWAIARIASKGKAATSSAEQNKPLLVFVLGYYRSGTTHLHYLLSCDPQFATPRWYQVMAPTGWWLSWTVIRWLLVPFLSSTRPQDDVAIGPEWPAEDDFAVCNASVACTMPGRMIFPGDEQWAHYSRYQTLENLTPRERACFRESLAAFVQRLTFKPFGSGTASKALLLKSPAHTARVRELVDLFGADRVRFIHLSRDPVPVLRSNVAMHRRFEPYLLMDPPAGGGDAADEVIRARIVREYDQTERAFLADRQELSSQVRFASVRYQDLTADPLAELRRCYAALGLEWTPAFESRATAYLASVSDYRTAAEKTKPNAGSSPAAKSSSNTSAESCPSELAWMLDAFGHNRPAIPQAVRTAEIHAKTMGTIGAKDASSRGALATPITALIAIVLWLAIASLTWDRMDWLVWPVGVLVGISTVRAAGAGSVRLGLWAALWTLLAMLVVAFPATAMTADYRHGSPPPWDHVWLSTHRGVTATNNIVWLLLGLMSAYRFASRKHISPPGMQ